MDDHRFAGFTRAIAAGASRRQALRLLAGGFFAGWHARRGRSDAAAFAGPDWRAGSRLSAPITALQDGPPPCGPNELCLRGICALNPAVELEPIPASGFEPGPVVGPGPIVRPPPPPDPDSCHPACDPVDAVCFDGICRPAGDCPAGQDLCPLDGCADVQTNATHCGASGKDCAGDATCRGAPGTPPPPGAARPVTDPPGPPPDTTDTPSGRLGWPFDPEDGRWAILN